jgi:hypothetical protein
MKGGGVDAQRGGLRVRVSLERGPLCRQLSVGVGTLAFEVSRWARIIKTLQDARFGPGVDAPDEHDEALRIVIDEMYEKAVKVRTMYYQSLKQARGSAEPQPAKAAAE